MKVLHISNKPVYPILDGGCVAMSGTLDCLKQLNYRIEHVCISTKKHQFDAAAYPTDFRVQAVEIDTSMSLFAALKQLFIGRSYNISRFETDTFKNILLEIVQSSTFDLIIFDSLYSAVFIHEIRRHSSAKLFIRTHNVEYKIWRELAKSSSNPLKKWYLNTLSRQLQTEERRILNLADGIMSITSDDLEDFKKMGINIPSQTIAVPRETEQVKTDYSSRTFYFIGSMNWEPNIEALHYLLDEIWPGLKKEIPEAQLLLIGSFMDKLNIPESNGVSVLGFVDNLDEIYLNEGILLLPIRSGSGVRIKVLEAMSKGAPIVSTQKGVEGIQSGTDCFVVATNTNDFIKKASEIYASQPLRESLGKNAQEFIRNNYSLETTANTIDEFVRSV
jgi:glycosyltransferase involved in cell wall biosynthesis